MCLFINGVELSINAEHCIPYGAVILSVNQIRWSNEEHCEEKIVCMWIVVLIRKCNEKYKNVMQMWLNVSMLLVLRLMMN